MGTSERDILTIERLLEAQRAASMGHWSYDIRRDHLQWSPTLFEYFELDPSEFRGTFDDFITRVHPDDRAAIVARWNEVLAERIRHETVQHRVTRTDGAVLHFEQMVTIEYDDAGEALHAHGIALNVTSRVEASQEADELNARLRKLAGLVPGVVYQYQLHPDGRGCFPYASNGLLAVYGVHPADVVEDATPVFERLHPEDLERVTERILHSAETLTVWRDEYRAILPCGRTLWLEGEATPEPRLDGSVVWHGYIRDITERRAIEDSLRQSASVFEHTHEGILITDARGVIVDTNRAFTRITGYARDEVLGRRPSLLSSGRQPPAFYRKMWETLLTTGHWSGEIWNRRRDGEVYAEILTISAVRDGSGEVTRYVGLFSDITAQKRHESELERIAHYDVLTQLPNRVLLGDRLQLAMERATTLGTSLAVVYIDLDGFKRVNDTWGHETGDQLITGVATRMRNALRTNDTLARLGGDEFVAVLPDLQTEEQSLPLIDALLRAAADTFEVGDLAMQITASAGVSFHPQPDEATTNADLLLRQADQAMYRAKQAGRNRYHVFDAVQDRAIQGQLEAVERIRKGLDLGEFVLFYQPKANLRTGAIIGAEALIRWQHPERGLLPPSTFLPLIAERSLSVELGLWVIDTALSQQAGWRAQGLRLPVSVNIDAHQLLQPDFVETLAARVQRCKGFQPGDLELEILETGALDKQHNVSRIIERCAELGVSFSIDDFGTGYSSLTYLKMLPARLLKIDQSFVRGMLDNPDDLSILTGVIGMANAFGRTVIAEGVETLEHGEVLLLLGCDLGQGYGIAHPMPAGRIADWTRSWTPPRRWLDSPPANRRVLPILHATAEHRAWLRAVCDHLHDHGPAPSTMDAATCGLGKLLASHALARVAPEPTIRRIDQEHRRIHARLASALDARAHDLPFEKARIADDLDFRRNRLLHELRELVREVNDNDDTYRVSGSHALTDPVDDG